MDRGLRAWWARHKPTRRRLIQLYAALLFNARAKGFIEGNIYTGAAKSVCVPGLNCYSCPAAVGACPLGALQNALIAADIRAPWYALGILMLYGVILGRTICGFLCPMGLIQELIYKIPVPKLKKSRVTRILSYGKYAVLALFVIAIPLFSGITPAFCKLICPAGTLEGAIGLTAHPKNGALRALLGAVFARKLAILIAVAAACAFIFRAFCRFLCPLGAIYGLFSKIALLGVRVDAHACTSCGRCVSHCKMDVRRVGDRECIHCGECASVCPTGAISMRLGKRTISNKPRAALRIAAALALILVLFIANWPTKEPQTAETGFEVGMRCPDVTVPLYGGGAFSTADGRGKTMILNFWATWCAPCVRELPEFESVLAQYGDSVRAAAIHTNMITEDVQGFINELGVNLPFALDGDGSAFAAFGGSTQLPLTVIVGPDGIIRLSRVGAITRGEIEEYIE